MSETIPAFTEEQAAAMVASQQVLDELRTHTKPILYDPAPDEGKLTVSMDKIWAELGLRSFGRRGPDPDGHNALLIMNCPNPDQAVEPKLLGKGWRDVLARQEYEPYRSLHLKYAGLISISSKDVDRREKYTAYQIHEPDTIVHGLGLIVGAHLVTRRELWPVEPNSSLGRALQTAADRLEHAANWEDLETHQH